MTLRRDVLLISTKDEVNFQFENMLCDALATYMQKYHNITLMHFSLF